jgi:membrane protease YdiL (CAAX protease family)
VTKRRSSKRGPLVEFFHEHSLSLVAVAILAGWLFLYTRSDHQTRWGSFYGNSVADWSGTLFLVIATKYFFEVGSAESRRVPRHPRNAVLDFLVCHSLTIFLVVTGVGWWFLYRSQDPQSKWGQVAGNVLSEWVQMLGIVFLTKRLLEHHSKESHR